MEEIFMDELLNSSNVAFEEWKDKVEEEQVCNYVRNAGPSRGRAGPGAIFWSGARMFKGAARRRNPWASGLMRFGLIY